MNILTDSVARSVANKQTNKQMYGRSVAPFTVQQQLPASPAPFGGQLPHSPGQPAGRHSVAGSSALRKRSILSFRQFSPLSHVTAFA
jgi:hypothetical protein